MSSSKNNDVVKNIFAQVVKFLTEYNADKFYQSREFRSKVMKGAVAVESPQFRGAPNSAVEIGLSSQSSNSHPPSGHRGV